MIFAASDYVGATTSEARGDDGSSAKDDFRSARSSTLRTSSDGPPPAAATTAVGAPHAARHRFAAAASKPSHCATIQTTAPSRGASGTSRGGGGGGAQTDCAPRAERAQATPPVLFNVSFRAYAARRPASRFGGRAADDRPPDRGRAATRRRDAAATSLPRPSLSSRARGPPRVDAIGPAADPPPGPGRTATHRRDDGAATAPPRPLLRGDLSSGACVVERARERDRIRNRAAAAPAQRTTSAAPASRNRCTAAFVPARCFSTLTRRTRASTDSAVQSISPPAGRRPSSISLDSALVRLDRRAGPRFLQDSAPSLAWARQRALVAQVSAAKHSLTTPAERRGS